MKKKALAVLFVVLFLIASAFLRSVSERKNLPDIHTISDLCGHRIVCMEGTVFPALIKEDDRLRDAEIVYTASNTSSLGQLLGGKADAMACDYFVAARLLEKNKELKMLPEHLSEEGFVIIFPKESPLSGEFNPVIEEFLQDGTIEALEKKWMGDDPSVRVPEEIPAAAGEKGTLLCIVNGETEPLNYTDENGTLQGFEIDLVNRIAAKLGVQVEYRISEFADLIPSVEAGEADFSVTGISATKERAERVDFSVPYFDNDAVLLVKEKDYGYNIPFMVDAFRQSFRRTVIDNGRWVEILEGVGTTIVIAILTIIFGSLLGGSLFLWEYSGKPSSVVVGWFYDFMTFMPISTWLLAVYYVFFNGSSSANFKAALCALTVSFAYLFLDCAEKSYAKLGQDEKDAAVSMGYGHYQALFLLYIPHLFPEFLSLFRFSVITHIQNTALVEMISVMDIQAVSDLIAAETFEPVFPILLTTVTYILLGVIGSSILMNLDVSVGREKTEEEIMARIRKERF